MAKKFKFNLQVALWHRQVLEDEQKRLFSLAQRDTLAAIHDKNILEEEVRRYQQRLVEDQGAKRINAPDIMATHTYLFHLNNLINEAENNITKLREAEEARRQELIEATKRKKALERLKEKQLKEYMHEMDLEEQKFQDDLSQIKYVRNQQGKTEV